MSKYKADQFFKALLASSERSQADDEFSIVKSTKGILFLGTPHSGSDLATYADALRACIRLSMVKVPNASNIQVLWRDSETLAGISESFSSLMNNWTEKVGCEGPQLFCFIEEKPIDRLGHLGVSPPGLLFSTVCLRLG